MIPASTFHKARTDWKGKVVAAETEARLLREQLEAAKKQPVAAAPPQQPPRLPEPVDPARDPVGYHNRVQSVLLNDRLNMSEMLERVKHTPEAFEAAVTEFQEACQATQPEAVPENSTPSEHPYGWLMKEVGEVAATARHAGRRSGSVSGADLQPKTTRQGVETEMRNGGGIAPYPRRRAAAVAGQHPIRRATQHGNGFSGAAIAIRGPVEA